MKCTTLKLTARNKGSPSLFNEAFAENIIQMDMKSLCAHSIHDQELISNHIIISNGTVQYEI